MTKLSGVKASGVGIIHELNYLSIPGLVQYIDFRKDVTLASGSAIREVKDQSGNGNHLVQTTAVRPSLITEGSFKLARFTGSQSLVATTKNFDWVHKTGSKFLIYVIAKPTNSANQTLNPIIGTSSGSTNDVGFILYTSDNATLIKRLNGYTLRGAAGTFPFGLETANNQIERSRIDLMNFTYYGYGATGNDGKLQASNGTVASGDSTANAPSAATSTYFLTMGGRSSPSLTVNYDVYASWIYNMSAYTTSQIDDYATSIKSLIYSEYSSILPV